MNFPILTFPVENEFFTVNKFDDCKRENLLKIQRGFRVGESGATQDVTLLLPRISIHQPDEDHEKVMVSYQIVITDMFIVDPGAHRTCVLFLSSSILVNA